MTVSPFFTGPDIYPDIFVSLYADMAELADALDLGSSVLRRGGSSPFIRIVLKKAGSYEAPAFFSYQTAYQNKKD